MKYSYDDKVIVSGGEDKLIKIWDPETFDLISSFEGSLKIVVLYLTF